MKSEIVRESDSELNALIQWSDSILFDGSALDFVLHFSNQSLVHLDSFSFYFPSADTGSAPSGSLCVFTYLCNCHKKILKYSTVNTLPPPETSESPENNHKTRGGSPNKPLITVSGPRGSCLPAGPLAASQHTSPPQYISVSLHLCFPSPFLPPSRSCLKSWGVFTTYELSSGQTLSGVYKCCISLRDTLRVRKNRGKNLK